MGLEIEKKFLVKALPEDLAEYPYHVIEQGYLNVHPAIRVRREDERYYMTYKGAHSEVPGEIGQEEYNLPLDKPSYAHMMAKADGNIINKKRYLMPLNKDAYESEYFKKRPELKELVIELDVFEGKFEGRVVAEVEFPNEEAARLYRPAEWFGDEVTGDIRYSNAQMSAEKL